MTQEPLPSSDPVWLAGYHYGLTAALRAQGDSASTHPTPFIDCEVHTTYQRHEAALREEAARQRDSATTEGAVRDLKALSDKATPGPWVDQCPDESAVPPRYWIDTHAYLDGPEPVVADTYPLGGPDAAFIAAAVNYVRALLADVPAPSATTERTVLALKQAANRYLRAERALDVNRNAGDTTELRIERGEAREALERALLADVPDETREEFAERKCPACSAVLAPDETHWRLYGLDGSYFCPPAASGTGAGESQS